MSIGGTMVKKIDLTNLMEQFKLESIGPYILYNEKDCKRGKFLPLAEHGMVGCKKTWDGVILYEKDHPDSQIITYMFRFNYLNVPKKGKNVNEKAEKAKKEFQNFLKHFYLFIKKWILVDKKAMKHEMMRCLGFHTGSHCFVSVLNCQAKEIETELIKNKINYKVISSHYKKEECPICGTFVKMSKSQKYGDCHNCSSKFIV